MWFVQLAVSNSFSLFFALTLCFCQKTLLIPFCCITDEQVSVSALLFQCQCAKYWPDDGPKTYDKLEVRPVDSIYYSDYAIRSFEIRRIQSTVSNGSVSGSPAILFYDAPNINGDIVADPSAVIVNAK